MDAGDHESAGTHALRFVVPGKPRGKGRGRAFAFKNKTTGKLGARVFTPDATAAYENLIKLEAQRAGARVLQGPVVVKITAFYAVPKSTAKARRGDMLADRIRPTVKPDADNIVKAVFDGLNGVCFVDDVQVVGHSLSKFYDIEPRLEIQVRPA